MKSFKPPYIHFASTNLHTNLTRTRARLLTFRAPPLSVPAAYANSLLQDYSFLSRVPFFPRPTGFSSVATKGFGISTDFWGWFYSGSPFFLRRMRKKKEYFRKKKLWNSLYHGFILAEWFNSFKYSIAIVGTLYTAISYSNRLLRFLGRFIAHFTAKNST